MMFEKHASMSPELVKLACVPGAVNILQPGSEMTTFSVMQQNNIPRFCWLAWQLVLYATYRLANRHSVFAVNTTYTNILIPSLIVVPTNFI